MPSLKLSLCVGVVATLFALPAAAQDIWNEGATDAGDLPATAQDATGLALRHIYGWLDTDNDVDMFKIEIIDPEQFGATTEKQRGTHPDTRLYLFDANGLGVYYNDDSPHTTDSLSTLPVGDSLAPTTPGIYYVAVSMYELVPLDEDSVEIFENPVDFGPNWKRINGPHSTKPVVEWLDRGTATTTGSYTISLGGLGGPPINVGVEEIVAPHSIVVTQPYPNPFSNMSTVDISVDSAQRVEASLYDILGRKVRTLHDAFQSPDETRRVSITADGLPAGTYFVRVQGSDFVTARMVTLAR